MSPPNCRLLRTCCSSGIIAGDAFYLRLGTHPVAQPSSSAPVRFGKFELDLRTGELRLDGASLELQAQPAKVLMLLVSRAGEVVTRQELARQVWGSETFVDFEQGLNFAIRQIRSALGDDADQPRFLETLPKRGYRFVALVNGAATFRAPKENRLPRGGQARSL